MGLRAYIFKSKLGDCSNGGLSGRVDEVTIVNAIGPFEPTAEAPPVLVVRGNVPGAVKAVAAVANGDGWEQERPAEMVGPMMGGCYVGGSDSRLGELIAKLGGEGKYVPVPLHDRFESRELYASMD